MFDIIIPVLNEEKILKESEPYYLSLKETARLIFVDGGSCDRTVEIAKRYGDVFSCRSGRGRQKNLGAQESQSDHILFLHVDSQISQDSLEAAGRVLSNGCAAGCFTMRIKDKGKMFRFYEKAVNLRARRRGIIDGDLGMFIRRQTFERAGGFEERPIMEDILFSKKLRRSIRAHTLCHPIYVSSRRWHEKGFIRTFLWYTLAYIQLWTGIPFLKEKTHS